MSKGGDGIGIRARGLWYVAAGAAELREEEVDASPAGWASVRTLVSAVSRGTESLVLEGRVPVGEHERMRAPFQGGNFPFPVKYGYASVGVVEEGPAELLGRRVFTLHPHQDRFAVPSAALAPVPGAVPDGRAALAANMETALNALWDSGAGPGDRIAVVGCGVVGALVARLAARLPGSEVTMVDVDPRRADLASAFGARFAEPGSVPADCDVVFHASASAGGLATAIEAAGFEARIVELSWYGEGTVAAPLGGAFHSRRLRLVASQVGHVAASRRARWPMTRRLAVALELLDDAVLDGLLAPEIAFEDLPRRLPAILSPSSGVLCQIVRY